MTDEEKKAQEEAAARAAEAEQAGGEAGGEAGNQEGGEGGAAGAEGGEAGGEGGEGEKGNEGGEGNEGGASATEPMPKEVFFERIRTGFPDGNFDDEQEYYRRAMEMMESAEAGNKKYNDFTDKLMRRYKDDPEEVAILMDYVEGMPLIEAIIKHKGEEALTMKEGDEGWEGYQQAVQSRKADRERYMSLMEEVKGNLASTVQTFNEWADELGLDDDKRAKIWEIANGDLENMSRGKFTREILDRYRTALDHDSDVEGAYEQGKAEGRNETIEATQAQMQGSGLPGMSAGGAEEKEEKEESEENPTAKYLAGFRHR